MSEQEQNNSTETLEEDARIQIKPKDATEQLLPGGKNVNELSNEEYATYTSNMVKADRLYAEHTKGLVDGDREVFDALLLASDKSLGVEERFEYALNKFKVVKGTQEQEETKATDNKEVPPQGNMETSGRNTVDSQNKLEPENDSPLGDNDDYFKFLEQRFKEQTTITRNKNKLN